MILISALLILALSITALADGVLSTLYNAGTNLMLNTPNVTLSGHAVFTYDGQRFKVFDGVYVQDGENSQMDVWLSTPLTNGGNYIGSYSVVANGAKVYELRSDAPGEFSQQTNVASSSILSNKDMKKLLVALGGTVVHLAEGGLNDAIAVTQNGEHTQYRLQLNSSSAPALVNKALSMISKEIIDEYFYAYERTLPLVTVDDRQQLIATFYEELYGEPLEKITVAPSEQELPTDYLRYENARQAMFDYLEDVQKSTPHSVVVIHGADKSQTTYDSFNDYLLSINQQILQFEDYSPALNAFLQQNPDSKTPDADMRAHYQQILTEKQCAGMLIEGDGDTILCYNDNELSRLAPYKQSVTQRICTQLEDVTLKSADITVTLDNRQRLTAFTGQLQMTIADFVGREHVLTIDFDCTAEAYGTSVVKLFDPKDYGITNYHLDDGTGNG